MKQTYISLFSSAGVGCYGFKMQGFDCIATNEFIERRLNVQKSNNKCKYMSGYIQGDITKDETKELLYSEIEMWKKNENLKQVDVVIATPPCQGMSVANHKKSDVEIIRNSLVVESIKIIKRIHPKVFIFENVPAFMKTICTDTDGIDKPISKAIFNNLANDYSYVSQVINFKNYGASSSRSRTLVIGVLKDYSDEVSPFELFPDYSKEKTLKDVIGYLPKLEIMGEIDKTDIYHFFRSYPEHMRNWIHDIKEGESAFDNSDINKIPHQIINNKIVLNQRKNGDKYTRTYWNKVGPCVHTRNDQLASQNTIHPSDDRVFSIRELMKMMTVPDCFKWSDYDWNELNNFSLNNKRSYLKKEEIKIRQCLGEAVPTIIFEQIACKIKKCFPKNKVSTSSILKIAKNNQFDSVSDVKNYILKNDDNLTLSEISRVIELVNTNRTDNAAYYTSKTLITEMLKRIPLIDKEEIHILEPSAGVGNFVPLILKKFESKKIYIDLMDIDKNSLETAKLLLSKYHLPKNCRINYIVDDFLLHKFNRKYDYIIGNPPFYKMKSMNNLLNEYRKLCINKNTTNICSFFLDKAVTIGNYVAFVFPKFLLNTPEFEMSRNYLRDKSIQCIIDFGEKGFPGVLIETISLFVNCNAKPSTTTVYSLTKNIEIIQKQKYIMDRKLPYWIIYRDSYFDHILSKIDTNCFNVFRDRQITNKILSKRGDIRVIKSRNISKDGKEYLDIENYDAYINTKDALNLSVYKYLNDENVYLTPNMTYYPRVIKKQKGILVNGSVAILIPKNNVVLSKKQCNYFSSNEYIKFYQIARNYQTRSLNIDKTSVFFFGILKDKY